MNERIVNAEQHVRVSSVLVNERLVSGYYNI